MIDNKPYPYDAYLASMMADTASSTNTDSVEPAPTPAAEQAPAAEQVADRSDLAKKIQRDKMIMLIAFAAISFIAIAFPLSGIVALKLGVAAGVVLAVAKLAPLIVIFGSFLIGVVVSRKLDSMASKA